MVLSIEPFSQTAPAPAQFWGALFTPPLKTLLPNLGIDHRTGETAPFVNRTVEWGVLVATFLSVLGIVPRHCARLTFLHPKLRTTTAVPITLPQEAFPRPLLWGSPTPASGGVRPLKKQLFWHLGRQHC